MYYLESHPGNLSYQVEADYFIVVIASVTEGVVFCEYRIGSAVICNRLFTPSVICVANKLLIFNNLLTYFRKARDQIKVRNLALLRETLNYFLKVSHKDSVFIESPKKVMA